MRGSVRWVVAAVLGALLSAAAPATAATYTCLTGNAPVVAQDETEVWAARNAVDMMCPCDAYDGSPGRTRAAYRKCAMAVTDSLIAAGHLRRQCRATLSRMSSDTTCGRPSSSGVVVCVRERLSNGAVTCSVKPRTRCTSSPGVDVETACAATRCLDAADSNGDMLLTSADSGRCTGGSVSPTPKPTPKPTPTPTPRPTSGAPAPLPTGSDGARLAQLVNQYRVASGKAPLPLSQAMMATAAAHVADLAAHPGIAVAPCNLHSWSQYGNGLWTGCCYTADHAQAACMWRKPSEISSGLGFARYPGNGYEIAFAGGGATPEQVLEAFKGSPPHNAVILNTGSWAFLDPYPAMGAAMRDGYAVVWFGDATDPWR